MRKIRFLTGIILVLIPLVGSAQGKDPADIQFNAALSPAEIGFRYDDNVFRTVTMDGREADEIYVLNGGFHLTSTYDVFKGDLGYRLGADQYQFYSVLNNVKNNFNLLLSAEPGDFSFYYRKEYFVRSSQYNQFNYWDDDNTLGTQWSPSGP